MDGRGSLAFAQVCACGKPCTECGDLGFLRTTREETFSGKVGPRHYEVLVDCACRLRERRVSLFNAAQLPAKTAGATFESYRPASSSQAQGRQVVSAFAQRYAPGGETRGFILSGPVGTGKTHLLSSAQSFLALEKGISAAYVEISLLFATIRRGFNEGKSGGEIIGPLSEVEVLAIDELGKGRGSQFELDTLDELISRRYNARRTTLFATNYSLAPERRSQGGARRSGYVDTSRDASGKGGEPELLRERVGERIYSRLCEMCDFIEFPPDTPDHRRGSTLR